MTLQWVAVAIIVPLCAMAAAWNLMGAAARRGVAGWLAKLPWPAVVARRLERARAAATACGCDGCDKNEATRAKAPSQSVVRLHRRGP